MVNENITIYLDDALRNMGEMVEYAYENNKQQDIFRMFLESGYAKRWDDGEPRIIAGMSGTELYYAILRACHVNYNQDNMRALIRYDAGEPYWCGYILAYYHWQSGRTFEAIFKDIDYDYLSRLYPAFHTASEERCVDEIQKIAIKKS